MKKFIYFVRHGESEGNVGVVREGLTNYTVPLTQKGLEQAQAIAERCVQLPIDAIVSSDMVRAKQTTEVILKKLNKPVEYSALFAERNRPSVTHELGKDHPKRRAIEEEIRKNFHKTGYRYSDEENFDDLKNRALKALQYLADRTEEDILVVTHGFIMRIVIAAAVLGDALTAEVGDRFVGTFHMENTGITVLGYDDSQEKPWWVWVWNDHAHLG